MDMTQTHTHSLFAPSQAVQRHTQQGASLIEVLVAALMLSLGMLVLVGVQASSVQLGQLAQFKGEASRLGQDFADRIRANRINANAYVIAGPYAGSTTLQTVPANCAATCNANEFATSITAIDLAQMRNQARLALPQGDFRVALRNVAGVGTEVDIWVIWLQATTSTDATRGGAGCPTNFSVTGATPPQCLLTRFVL